jgi:hypothetical protein
MARRRKAMSTVRKREKNATVDLTVQRRIRNVKMNQPWRDEGLVMLCFSLAQKREELRMAYE